MTASNPDRRPTALQVALAATELREPQPSTGEVLAAFMDPVVTAPHTVETQPVSVAPQTAAPVGPAPTDQTRTLLFEPAAPPRHRRPARRRTWVLALIAFVVALIIATAVAVAIAVSTNSAPDPTPSLPAVEEPLGTHLQDLLEEVSP